MRNGTNGYPARDHGLASAVSEQPGRPLLREVLGQYPTGVTVITTMTARGPVGMTANSFSSVSLNPPLVLFSVARTSQMCEHLTGADAFAVNVLNATQRAVSTQFARPGFDRFGEVRWSPGGTGVPVLAGVRAVLECEVADVHAGGDHLITVGRVLDAYVQDDATAPLVFFLGQYQQVTTVPDLRH